MIVVGVSIAAILGDQTGYHIGKRFGPRLFRPDARVFKTRNVNEADAFFTKYGGRFLVLARFVPIVRTFVLPVVGISKLPFRTFLIWNAIGGIAWALILTLAGYFLGGIPFVANNVEIIAVIIAVISIGPVVVSFIRNRRKNRNA